MDIPSTEVITWCIIGASVIGSGIGVFSKVYPTIRKLQTLVDDWVGEPPRPGVPARPGVMERLEKLERFSESTNYHVQPNHGGSAYDRLFGKVEAVVNSKD